MKQCATESCRKQAQKHRTICRSCRTKRERDADPERYAFMVLRKHAKERKIPFTIDLPYFRQFCVKTGYIARKGRFKDSYHVDRIKEYLGYIPGNIQALTNSQNVIKFLDYKYADSRMQFKMQTTVINNEQGSCPF